MFPDLMSTMSKNYLPNKSKDKKENYIHYLSPPATFPIFEHITIYLGLKIGDF